MKIFQYLQSLPDTDLHDLYTDSFTCQAILRSLQPRAKQYILRMLLVDCVPVKIINQWTADTSNQAHKEAIKRLLDLKILQKRKIVQSTNADQLTLESRFKENLKSSLLHLNNVPFQVNDPRKQTQTSIMSIEELDAYSKKQWEDVLYYLSDEKVNAPKLISELLHTANLTVVNSGSGDSSFSITSEGFKFLLKDIYTQIWSLLIVYFNTMDTISRRDALKFLFKLSFTTLGKAYLLSTLNQNEIRLLNDLKQFGLVYIRSKKSDIFYPTRLALSLVTGKTISLMNDLAQEMSNTQKNQGYIILETNFRIYAYTNSSLQISLLNLFVKMLYKLPNLTVGILTRESIRSAFLHGITADQIVDFVKQNAHPNLIKAGFPEVVFEQIKIWEAERNRIIYKKSILFNSFPTVDSFNQTVQFAKDHNFLIWQSDEKGKQLVVSDEGGEAIRGFIQKIFG